MRKLLPQPLLKNSLRRLAHGSESSPQEERAKTGAGPGGKGARDTVWRTDARIFAPQYELVSCGWFCFAASPGYFWHARSAGDAPHAATSEGSAARDRAA